MHVIAGTIDIGHDTVDTVGVWLEVLEAEVEIDDEVDDQGGADADGQAQDIDQGKDFCRP